MMEGQTATNPQTGEKVIMRGGQWVPAGGQMASPSPAPQQRPQPRLIFEAPAAPEKPKEPPSGFSWNGNGGLAPIPGGPADPNTRASDPPSGYRWGPGGTLVAIPGGPAEKNAGSDGAKSADIQALLRQINRVEELYQKNLKGGWSNKIAGNVPALIRPENEQFSSAAASMAEIGLSAFRVPGVGSQSDAELRQFVEANRPLATDTDEAIEEKLMAMRNRIAQRMQAEEGGVKSPPTPKQPDRPEGAVMFNDDPNAPPPPIGFRMSPDQEKRLQEFSPEAQSPSEIIAFARGLGANITPENAQAVFDYYQKGGKQRAGFDYSQSEKQRQDELKAILEQRGQNDMGALGSAQQLIGQGASFGLSDEFSGIAGALTGGSYEEERDLARMRQDQARDKLGGAGTALEVAGGFLTANPNALMTAAPTLAGRVAQGAKAGAGAGASAGFGYGDGATDSLQGAMAGGVVGGLVGGAVPVAGAALSRSPKSTAAQQGRNALMNTAQDIGVDLVPADVGGPFARRMTSAAAQGPISAVPVINASRKAVGQVADARMAAAERAGVLLPADEAGEAVRKGADLFVKQTSARGSRLYDKAEQATRGVKIKTPGASKEIDTIITELKQSGEVSKPLIDDLEKFRRSVEQLGGVSVKGLRDVRTMIAAEARKDTLRGSNAQRLYGRVADAVSKDIEAGLVSVGRPEAARMFKTADAFWKARIQQIDEVLQPVIGKGKSGEDILGAVERMTQGKSGGVKRLARLLSSLPDDEAGSVRATIINRIGGEGDAFSPTKFATAWNERMSAKGKAALFGNSGLRDDLDKIAQVASAMKEAQKYQNFSNTAGGIGGQILLTGGAGSMGLTALALASVAQYGGGRLLASPAFARWLAKAPKNPAAAKAYTGQLSRVAALEPAISGDIKGLQTYLAKAFEASPSRAAAEQEPDRRGVPPQ